MNDTPKKTHLEAENIFTPHIDWEN